MTLAQSKFEHELAELIVEALELEDVEAAGIEPEAPLFRQGLGLDSIDALELSLAIAKKYGVQLKAEDEQDRVAFSSLRALAAYVSGRRAAAS
ncbi:MAG: phosphopantetheine-binding protein [Gammaproteobacteria bacterium]